MFMFYASEDNKFDKFHITSQEGDDTIQWKMCNNILLCCVY